MKVDDILKIDKKESNRTKAAFIRAQIKKKAKENNPSPNTHQGGWNFSQFAGGIDNGDF